MIIVQGEGVSSANFVSWISLFFSGAALLLSTYWSRRSEKRSYLDVFWFRIIVAPKCIQPFIDLTSSWSARVDSVVVKNFDVNAARKFITDFQIEKARILNDVWLVKIFSSDYYDACCRGLDDLEDGIVESIRRAVFISDSDRRLTALKSFASDTKATLSDTSVKLLRQAMKLHASSKMTAD